MKKFSGLIGFILSNIKDDIVNDGIDIVIQESTSDVLGLVKIDDVIIEVKQSVEHLSEAEKVFEELDIQRVKFSKYHIAIKLLQIE